MKSFDLLMFTRSFRSLLWAAAIVSGPSLAQGAIASYYVGVDTLQNIASGTYAGLPNPNYQRLTFLYAHSFEARPGINHYHSKGTQIYTGPNLGAGTAVTTSASNFVPEGANPPLVLSVANGGLYDNKLISAPIAGNAFSFLTLEDTGKLSGFAAGTGEHFMFNSSSGRWTGSLVGADVHLQLVSLSAGLNVGSSAALNLFVNPGDELHLEDSFSFTPVFWTDADAAVGTYTATFKLTDERGVGALGDSGNFEYRFQVIPEPSSIAVLSVAGIAFGFRRKRANRS
jgi:hypothetical protein